MNTQNFQEGFVKKCVAKGLNREETEALAKLAHYASAFDNEGFRETFNNRLVPEASSDNLTLLKKATLVRSAINKMYGSDLAG